MQLSHAVAVYDYFEMCIVESDAVLASQPDREQMLKYSPGACTECVKKVAVLVILDGWSWSVRK